MSAEQLMKVSADAVYHYEKDDIVKIATWPRLPAVKAGQSVTIGQTELPGGPNYRSYRLTLAYLEKQLGSLRADVVDETKW